ncbi:MAG TPA: hypothetical protein VLA22_09045 [Gaiellaceae bacterium]|nr:hypothetical protein [Gaiellaceae bacterium]
MSKRTESPGSGSVASAVLTGASTLVVSGVAAGVGVVIAREFGRSDQTDGLLAAYGVFIVLAIAAQAIRVALLPSLAKARAESRLASEMAGFALAITVVAVPLVLVAELEADELASLLTGGGVAGDTAAEALRWMVPAAVAYLYASLAASSLAALDDYGTAALGFALGSIAGLLLIVSRAEPDGIVAVAWGMTLNGTIALLVPCIGLLVKAVGERVPARAARPGGLSLRSRVGMFATGAMLPLALQLLYLTCLALAGRLGPGEATSFVYAYLAAASLVTVTAASMGLVTSVPLTRAGLGAAAAARHVVSTSWLALVFVGAAAGVFALAGGQVVEALLGDAYAGDIGADLGRLVVAMSPWMIASIGVTVTFPLAFVAGRTRGLVWLALGVVALQIPLAWAAGEVLGLTGLALALALATGFVLAVLLGELGALGAAVPGLLVASLVVAASAAVAFGLPALVLGPGVAGAVGLLLYALILALLRPGGLVASWRYLRTLA